MRLLNEGNPERHEHGGVEGLEQDDRDAPKRGRLVGAAPAMMKGGK